MITLITGGARSGKSSFAESRFNGKSDVVYIATSRTEDDEMKERVIHHRSCRPDSWRTFEGDYSIAEAVGIEKYYLLDCITVLTSNILFDMSKEAEVIDSGLQKAIEDKVVERIKALVDKVREADLELIMVTNEVGCSIVPENHVARIYRDIAGRVNQRAAEMADEAYAVFCGIPVKLK
ncbi:MAG: bifunctional adenosylcobinamide kinase/adenosylcobinamide-phosphate guanylyltransferase [Clostridiaceae bacterium]